MNIHTLAICSRSSKRSATRVFLLPFLLFHFQPLKVIGQQDKETAIQRTMLQMSAASLTVITQGLILLDSTVILNAQYRSISRIPVITEGFDTTFCKQYAGWMKTGNVDSMVAALPRMDRNIRIPARLMVGAWYAFQPGTEHYRKAIEQLTIADNEAEKMGNTEWTAEARCLLMKAFYMLTDTAKGNFWYVSIIHNPGFTDLPELQAKTRSYAGVFCPFLRETTGFRLNCLSDALARYQILKDTGNQINTLMDIAYLSFAAGNPTGANTTAEESLRLQDAWHFPFKQYSYDLLAFLKTINNEYGDALKLAMETLKAVEATNDRFYIAHAYVRIARSSQELHDLTAANKWYKLALQACIETRKREDLYQILENLGTRNFDLGLSSDAVNTVELLLKKYPPRSDGESQLAFEALGSCFESKKDYPKARDYFMQAWQMEDELSNNVKGGMTNSYLIRKLGQINILLGNFREGRKFLMMLFSPDLVKTVPQEDLAKACYTLYSLDSVTGDFKSAVHWLVQYNKLQDKVNDESQSKQIIDLNVKYETLQREKRLQQLQAQNQMEVQKAASARKLYIAGFILLGLVIVMVYIRYRNNKRTNSQLRTQKEEIDQQNIELHELNHRQLVLLEEKDWLLREVHHRVKNNLQVITSLLSSQSEFLKDETAARVILESQHRVEAMSLIHQKLYNSENLSNINMPDYIGELVDYLRDSFDMSKKVVFDLSIERIRLDVSKAVPVGLILNEAITNAFKYAFPKGTDDRISIRLFSEDGRITLQVADNGHGLPENFDAGNADSFGMILMRGMAEDLEGTIHIDGINGTVIIVSFDNQAYAIS